MTLFAAFRYLQTFLFQSKIRLHAGKNVDVFYYEHRWKLGFPFHRFNIKTLHTGKHYGELESRLGVRIRNYVFLHHSVICHIIEK